MNGTMLMTSLHQHQSQSSPHLPAPLATESFSAPEAQESFSPTCQDHQDAKDHVLEVVLDVRPTLKARSHRHLPTRKAHAASSKTGLEKTELPRPRASVLEEAPRLAKAVKVSTPIRNPPGKQTLQCSAWPVGLAAAAALPATGLAQNSFSHNIICACVHAHMQTTSAFKRGSIAISFSTCLRSGGISNVCSEVPMPRRSVGA